jgi:hypothetical protein
MRTLLGDPEQATLRARYSIATVPLSRWSVVLGPWSRDPGP